MLEKNKIVASPLAAKVKDLVSLRNLLVHRYGKIDEDREYQDIQENHEDIILFVQEIELFLKKEK